MWCVLGARVQSLATENEAHSSAHLKPDVLTQKASPAKKKRKKKRICKDNYMFLLNYRSSRERITRFLVSYLLRESRKKCRGYLLWFVKHPKPFKHTTCEKGSEGITSKSNIAASYANTKKGNRASVFFIAPANAPDTQTVSFSARGFVEVQVITVT